MGRKNWLFIGSIPAGERAADFLTLVSSAWRNDLDVWAYIGISLIVCSAAKPTMLHSAPMSGAKSTPKKFATTASANGEFVLTAGDTAETTADAPTSRAPAPMVLMGAYVVAGRPSIKSKRPSANARGERRADRMILAASAWRFVRPKGQPLRQPGGAFEPLRGTGEETGSRNSG